MDNAEKTYDIALSFAGEDRAFVEKVAKYLKDKSVRVFYDKDEEVYLWGKEIGDTLDTVYRVRSDFVVIFISEHYARKMWTNHERQSAFARAIKENREFVLPARFDDTELTGLRPTVAYVDLRKETPESFALKITQKLTISNNTSISTNQILKEHIYAKEVQLLNSLRSRLEKDFYTAGPRFGQFGKERIQGETQLYRESVGELIKFKPHYYMTYWGWKLAPDLIPHLAEKWIHLTAAALKDRFAGKRWIDVELEDYDHGPALSEMKAETVRHTVKAAEILLLLHLTNIPSQVAWNLINESQLLSTNGGWKEFRSKDGSASLWASAYVFRFLSKLRERKCDPGVPGEVTSFIASSEEVIQRTESYLESSWYESKWSFNRLPWEVNAPVMLIECVPFLHDEMLIRNAFESLRELITPAGCLINPDIGTPFKAPEYIMSIRLAYALKLCVLLKGWADSRVDNLARWVLDNYSDGYTLDTCDTAFLYGLFYSTSNIAF